MPRGLLENSFVNLRLRASSRFERGEGRLKAIVYTAILIVGVFIAVKLVPLYVAEYQLKDKMSEQARFAVVNHYTEEQMRDIIFKTVQDLDIPAQRDDIKMANTNHGVTISVNYTVPVDFLLYKTDMRFAPSSDGLDIMK
jgi:hypothetical protein